MTELAPLPVAIPLLGAGLLAAGTPFLSRRASDAIAIAAALAAFVLTALLLAHAGGGTLVHWLGDWRPNDGVALGIDLVVDPIAAGLALLVLAVVISVFVFSWQYFDYVGPLFYALMLVFLAGMVGFSLTGDMFNLFVFLEVMSVAAYALTAYHNDEAGSLQGALNFAVTNSLGSFLVASAIGLLYARTGALNMAQMGAALTGHDADALVITSFVLLMCGFFVKAGIMPFHFWLADAYSVAPSPVCAVFSAAFAELGLYAAARVYWVVFSGVFEGDEPTIRAVLVAVGGLTALIAALMAFSELHLKRLLAFATISHLGLFLVGIALLSAEGLAGVAIYAVGDGLVKASLFLGVGILAYRWGTAEELELRGAARRLPIVGALFVVGGLALASLPPCGPFLGKSMIDQAGSELGYWWLPALFIVSTALTGGAVLRAAARLFSRGTPTVREEEKGEKEHLPQARRRALAILTVPTAGLMVAAIAWGVVPGLRGDVEAAAAQFQDRSGYTAVVLHEREPRSSGAVAGKGVEAKDFLVAGLSILGAVALALVAAFGVPRAGSRRRRRLATQRRLGRPARAGAAALSWLKAIHSGHVGDYATWLVIGIALLGGVFALTLS